MRNIRFIWPSARPQMLIKTHQHWVDTADHPERIIVKIAVDTAEQREELSEFDDVIVTGKKRCGVVAAVNALTKDLKTEPGDIIILISDDFYSPPHWDTWICEQFVKFNGCILVKDGYQAGGCVTIPILDHHCFKKLNKIIYHPSYFHQFSDAELWHNLKDLGLLKNLRKKKHEKDKPFPIFEHRHWVNGKRKHDGLDANMARNGGKDIKNFNARMKMPVAKRVKA